MRKATEQEKENRDRTYRAWKSLHRRCKYNDYGYENISVCDRWQKYENFLSDMGPVPDGFSLDRVNTKKDYSPENCRWADWYTQAQNSSKSIRWFLGFRVFQSLSEAAKYYGVNPKTIQRWCKGRDGKPPRKACSWEYKYQQR